VTWTSFLGRHSKGEPQAQKGGGRQSPSDRISLHCYSLIAQAAGHAMQVL